MKKKINIRLVMIAILAIVSTLIACTLLYYNLFQKQIRKDLATSAKLVKDADYFESVDIDKDKIDLSTDINELRVTWIDKDGTVLYDNDVTADNLANHSDRPEVKEAFKNGVGESVRKSNTLNKNTFYYALLLDNDTVLRVATNSDSILSVFLSVAWVIALIVLLIITICIIISHLLTKQLLKPIEMMTENLDSPDYKSPYKELEPFSEKFKAQHTEILSAAKVRQDFTANVSHELKTPLTTISGYSELLENGLVEEKEKSHIYEEIHKQSDRLLVLINDIIRLSEFDRSANGLEFQEIDLYEIASGCVQDLSINAEKKGVDISFEGERKSIIYGNENMVKELIENLTQNAITYNNPGGKVSVSVRKKNEKILLEVKDNGIGIPLSEQDRIFERFYRVDKSRSKSTGGTGLGLSIVKHIVELHDAIIKIDSALGVGTTMTVIF